MPSSQSSPRSSKPLKPSKSLPLSVKTSYPVIHDVPDLFSRLRMETNFQKLGTHLQVREVMSTGNLELTCTLPPTGGRVTVILPREDFKILSKFLSEWAEMLSTLDDAESRIRESFGEKAEMKISYVMPGGDVSKK